MAGEYELSRFKTGAPKLAAKRRQIDFISVIMKTV
jgi:hypothetical protein